ncbi:hypothetical protein BJX66DRAFT_316890 [Aspergillus keveii]|uniref:Uncharacterized protein n=1 Tax=Aspergillus keveii TaxID=714993 RepID=A0ABR4FM16_9EURO
MTGFTPLLPPRPVENGVQDPKKRIRVPTTPPPISAMVRENMTLSSWLLVGGLFQGIGIHLLGTRALVPTTIVILYRVLDHLLMACNITRNRYMDAFGSLCGRRLMRGVVRCDRHRRGCSSSGWRTLRRIKGSFMTGRLLSKCSTGHTAMKPLVA